MRRARGLGAGLALAAAALLACDTGFAPQYRVKDLRLLAVRATVPGAAPWADPDVGETVTLEALLANPQALPDVRVRWRACLPVDGVTVPPCLDADVLRDPAALDGRPGVLDLGEGTSVAFTVPDALAPALTALIGRAEVEPELACALYLELPVVAIASAAGTVRLAVKTVRVTPWREVASRGGTLGASYPRNANPRLVDVLRAPLDAPSCDGGAPLRSPLPAGPQALCAAADVSTAYDQIYPQCRAGGVRVPFFEGLSAQWYVTGGTLSPQGGFPAGDRGDAVDDRVTLERPAGPFTLWVILRDGRGGVDWRRWDFP